ncbi:hypothetical protein XBKQ1_400022 [Xenorhabdus bovienii str. kraussei Quebec]|uniref:Uncharacterized protein n=2 Tax=Xenorhabdus bovienii TaxID=40576 RepID=A0A077PK40_XENBV|nr:hypothetical protein XBKQ1_400022 [Xenorhabdus bovienii str. kraussei Quebec]CDH31193.1 hypothetical protein XBI1_1370011 [Xenorhabdus bovienii str. Intermedium]
MLVGLICGSYLAASGVGHFANKSQLPGIHQHSAYDGLFWRLTVDNARYQAASI